MGDDPYDFDIAIPSGKGSSSAYGGAEGGGGKGRGRGRAHSSEASVSGGNDSDRNDSGSDVSLSSDSDGGHYKQMKKETTAKPQRRQPVGGGEGGGAAPRGAALTGATATRGGGSSALDKAKSFLSKYSTKTTAATPASTRGMSRRVEMSLDDEEFSLDSSGEAPKKPTPARASARKQVSANESDDDDESGDKSGVSRQTFSDDDESTSVVQVVNPPAPVIKMPQKFEEASRHLPINERAIPKPTVAAPSGSVAIPWLSNTIKASVSADDDEIESIASQSDHDDSIDQRKPASTSTPARVSVVASVAPSESGVYEDEEFEDASITVSARPTTAAVPTVAIKAAETLLNEEESHVHYSLDFADDTDMPVTRDPPRYDQPTPRDHQDDDTRSNNSSASERNKDSYVEEDSGEDQRVHEDSHHGEPEEPQRIDSMETFKLAHEESEEYSQDDRFESESVVTIPLPNQSKQPDAPVIGKGDKLPVQTGLFKTHSSTVVDPVQRTHQLPLVNDQRERSRPRVQIVREYDRERVNVEKKDASTQFTGNHASIQTDLTPDGMLTGMKPGRNREPSTTNGQSGNSRLESGGLPSPIDPSEMRQPDPIVPPPPPSSVASYGLYDPLHLPTGTSMSIYKQQLLSLQQQIYQKKLETERLFRDRISTQYTSLRGTERFLTANRPPRTPLWEALVRVDPSLDEAKAKEIARMASGGAA